MTTYRDLAPLPYFGAGTSEALVAVGWLGRGQPYAKGAIPAAVYNRLKELLVQPFQPFASGGFHECEFCQSAKHKGNANLFVPEEGRVFVCPELILHYISAHEYQPPREFCDAVLACPDTGSVEYERLFLANGGRALVPSAG